MAKEGKKKNPILKVLKVIGIILLIIILLVGGLFAWLTVKEYKPEDVEAVEIEKEGDNDSSKLPLGDTFTIMTWNMGYGALGENADFFMDGGTGVMTATADEVDQNVKAIADTVAEYDTDFVFLQEVDRDSKRSHNKDEYASLADALCKKSDDADGDAFLTHAFAYNYKVPYVPYPVPPLGKINGGIATFSKYDMEKGERIQLPCPFKWPVRLGNLKRCLLITRIPLLMKSDLDDTENMKYLVLINLHLEAYDDGEGKKAQTELLKALLEYEAEQGNYVVAGGDFNQTFSNVDSSMYPELPDMWHCGAIDAETFDDGWQLMMDNTVPTCRSLDKAYKGADHDNFQYYLIDGFIVSGNIKVDKIETVDKQFVNTDHNPVVMTFTLDE